MKKIATVLLFLLIAAIPSTLFAKEVILVHLSDTHIILEPAGTKGTVSIARAMTKINEIKAQNSDAHVIVVHSGDFLAPSETSKFFKGKDVVRALEAAGVTVAALGNHEFDYTTAVLLERAKSATFPFVSANVERKNGASLPHIQPYVIKLVGDLRIAFFGLTTKDNTMATLAKFGDDVRITDPAEAAKKVVADIQKSGAADMIVALAHLEADEDESVLKNVPGIHLLLGGHEHLSVNTEFEGVPRVKVRNDLQDISVTKVSRDAKTGKFSIYPEVIPITRDVPLDPKMEVVLEEIRNEVSEVNSKVIGTLPVGQDATWSTLMKEVNTTSASAGTWTVELFRQALGGDVAFMNVGIIARANRMFGPGPMTEGDLGLLFPWTDPPVMIETTGKVIRTKFENMLSRAANEIAAAYARDPNQKPWSGKFPIAAGLEVEWDLTRPEGSRLTKLNYQGAPLKDDQVLRAVINLFVYNSDADLRQEKLLVDAVRTEIEVLREQIQKNYPVKPCEAPLKK
jgi:2',3'-cyclic-nucleotide 2'-phosphodiesterase (5'-nucleotidase family)